MELEVDCERCQGKGTILFIPPGNRKGTGYDIKCPQGCKQGKVPSELGEKVLEFIMKHLDLEEIENQLSEHANRIHSLEYK